MVSKIGVPGTQPTYYEISSTLKLANSGGWYVQYLRASNDTIGGIQGSHYHVEIANPTFTGSGNTGTCSSSLNVYKRVNGVVTLLRSGAAPCRDGMVVRTMIVPLNGSPFLQTYIDNQLQYQLTLSSAELTTGQPGVGTWSTPAGSGISQVQLGPLDALPPPVFDPAQMSTMPLPTEIWFDWPGVLDDSPNGTGVVKYDFFRASGGGGLAWIGSTSSPEFRDMGLSPSTAYTYRIFATDYHQNYNYFDLTINTPPAGAVNPRQIGLRSSTAFWGAEGEQIDMRSGNLNFTLPILKAQGRGGSSAAFALNYNSQQWVYHSGRTWKFGKDTGFGFGWKFGLGSLTPVWSGAWALNSVVFTDTSGTEYLLDQYSNGVFTSKDSYVNYDLSTNRVCFNDGVCWLMEVVSGGSEADAGTYYASRVIDTNGNWIQIKYDTGAGAPVANSSSRPISVEDVRAAPLGNDRVSYTFAYTNSHLTGIASNIGSGENYTLSYAPQSLGSPFSAETFGSTQTLSYLQRDGLGTRHTPLYNSSGEMTQMTLPLGAVLGWTHSEFTFTGSRKVREVSSRTQKSTAAGTLYTYNLTHDAGDGTLSFHKLTTVNDVGASSSKRYTYGINSAATDFGKVTLYESLDGGGAVKSSDAYTWATDPVGRPYIGTTTSTIDVGGTPKVSKVEQQLDQYGNVQWRKEYNFGPGTVAKWYEYTYLNSAAYTNKFIRNRLTQVTLKDGAGGQLTTLVYNTYDNYTGQYAMVTRNFLNEHDSANYGTGVTLRGNPSTQDGSGQSTQFQFDITGMPATAWRNGVKVDVTPAQNNAVPGAMTPNSNGAMATSMNWNSFLGLTQVTGANGASASQQFDIYGRKTQSTSPTGAVTTYAYSYNPPVVTATTGTRWVKSTQDGFGRPIKDETGYGTTTVSVVDTEYAPCGCTPIGKMKRVSRPHAPGATQYWTTYNYDALGRTVSVVAADGASTSTYTYVGNTVKTTDPTGKWKKFEMDAVGNLTQVTEPNPAGGADLLTNYTYNLRGELLTVSMPRSVTQTRTFTYDSEGRTLTATNPETGLTTYTYNGDSTLSTKVDAKFQKIAYFYDAYKRVVEIKRYPKDPSLNQPSGTEDVCQNTKFYYDGNPYGYGANLVGRMAWVEYPICAPNKNGVAITRTVRDMSSYSTDGRQTGRRWRLVRPFEGNLSHTPFADADFSMAYDGIAGLKQLVQPDFKTWDASNHTIYTSAGYTLDYSFDSMYQLTGLTRKQGSNPAQNVVTGMTYGAAGELLTVQHWQTGGGNAGQYETRQYNVMGQLTRLQATATGGTAVDLKYYHSATQNNGRITQRENVISGEMVTYTYDSLQRLTAASAAGPSPWSESYAYDGFGNLTGKAGANWNVDGLTNRITGLNYDSNGNQNNSTISVYDIDNRLLTWDGTEQYRYAPDNKRVFRRYTDAQNVIQEVYSVYGPNGKVSVELAAVYDPAGGSTPGMVLNPTNTYQYIGLRRVGWGEPMPDMLDTKAAGSGRPYGENVSHFAGHDKDASGLHYADQRYYTSSWGRFLTADPYKASAGAGDPGSWNRYGYVLGDAVNFNDPEGRMVCWAQQTVQVGSDAPMTNILCKSNDGLQSASAWWEVSNVRPNDTEIGKLLQRAAEEFLNIDEFRDMDLMPDAIGRAISALQDPGCAGLYGTSATRAAGWNPVDVVTKLFVNRNGPLGSVNFELYDPKTVAQVRVSFTAPLSNVVVSFNRLFWNRGNTEENALTLLHEMAHAYNYLFLQGSGGFAISNLRELSPIDSDTKGVGPYVFDRTILEKCKLNVAPR
ncbi:MAG: RHS repeat-associated core domain-containing protein [Bryobacteraceae bacterium]